MDFGTRESAARRGTELVDWLRGFLREEAHSTPNLTRSDLDNIVKAYDARVSELGDDPRNLLSLCRATQADLVIAQGAAAELERRLRSVEVKGQRAEEAIAFASTFRPCLGPHCSHPGACRCTCVQCVQRRLAEAVSNILLGV